MSPFNCPRCGTPITGDCACGFTTPPHVIHQIQEMRRPVTDTSDLLRILSTFPDEDDNLDLDLN